MRYFYISREALVLKAPLRFCFMILAIKKRAEFPPSEYQQ